MECHMVQSTFQQECRQKHWQKVLATSRQHFLQNSTLHKIFNRNTLKGSYSYMDNMGKIINAHNKSILKEKPDSTTRSCNCRKTNDCPLQGKCLTKSIVYKATVTTNRDTKGYTGVSESKFKLRWYIVCGYTTGITTYHKSSYKLEHKKKQTELNKHIRFLKDSKIDYELKWSILKHASSYSNNTKRCHLCLWEKYYITISEKSKTLNSRSKLISKCRHANKFLLKNS